MMNPRNAINGIRVKVGRKYKRQYVRTLIEKAGKCRFCDESDVTTLTFVQTGGRWPLPKTVVTMAAEGASWKSLDKAISLSSVVCLNHQRKIKENPDFLNTHIQETQAIGKKAKDEKANLARLKREYGL